MPHDFKGRPDRWCEVCNLPDRNPIHDVPATTSVTRYERDTNAVSNAAPHHTTPHHTTKNTSSRTDAPSRGRQATAELRDIHPLDALAVTVAWIRPDWNIALLRAVLARCNGSHHELAERALRVALNPDARTPAAIENAGPIRRVNVAQTYPTVDEALNPELDAHGFPVGACPICRKGAA